jgi:hypothetical protein
MMPASSTPAVDSPPPFRSQAAWLLLAAAIVILFYSQLLFTNRFSFLLDKDDANQAYAWSRFTAANIQKGILPLWDPNTQGGHSFIGEMQTGLFYPLKLPLYVWPLDRSGLPSMRPLHVSYAGAHVLAAWFMFLLACEIGLGRFASLVAGLCFSLGGFLGGPVAWGWPHLLDSGIWLPLILLFLTRSLRHPDLLRAILNACLAGLGLAMVVLAGGLHLAIMDVLAVAGLAAVFAGAPPRVALGRVLTAVGVAGVISFAASAVQLLPSIEFSAGVRRYINDWLWLPATQKIPYDQIFYNYPPGAAFAFLFGGASIGLAEFSPYFGLLPLLLALLGAWRYRDRPWPRYLVGMALLAFLYSLGSFTPFHRLLYTFVPYLWLAKEPARFIYLTHTATALLAGFGIEALFAQSRSSQSRFSQAQWANLLHRWRYLPQVLLVLLMVFDWHYFNHAIQSKREARQAGRDHLEKLLGFRPLATFFQSQPGLFRINIDGPSQLNIGDLFGVQTVSDPGSTVSIEFQRVWRVRMAADLLNVRFFVCATNACPAGMTPAYRDVNWTAFENTEVYPRAWLVHDAIVETSPEAAVQRMNSPGFDPLKTAVLAESLAESPEDPLQPRPAGMAEGAVVETFEPNHLTLGVRASRRALLVLSENYSPGWRASVNGTDTRIHRLDVTLRGILVPAGESRVDLRYLPRSVIAGAILSSVTWAVVLAWAGTVAWFAFRTRAVT